MNGERRVTQREIAEEAKCDRATVSLALRNNPAISLATRERIQAVALRLNYVPDPLLSALAAYRKAQAPVRYRGVLGWITNSPESDPWDGNPYFKSYFNGASDRALAAGYRLATFNLRKRGMTPARSAQMLRARGINGLLLCPQSAPNTDLDFPFENFSAVTLGYSLRSPALHMVSATQFRAMLLTMRQLHLHGYSRVGLVLSLAYDERLDHQYRAAYTFEAANLNRGKPIPPFTDPLVGPRSTAAFLEWVNRHKPDALITGSDEELVSLLRSAGLKVPEDIAVALLTVPAADGKYAGIYEDCRHIGSVAIDTLIAMINRNERGVPDLQQRILVESRWVNGKTARAVLPV